MAQTRLSDTHLLSSAWNEIEKSLAEFIQNQEQSNEVPLPIDFECHSSTSPYESQAAA